MKRKRAISIIAVILALLMMFSLVASVLPTMAYAVTQSDIDELREHKNEVSDMVKDCQKRIELLQAEQANVLEQKAALDAQNTYANEQLELVSQEIDAYDELIAEKAEELDEALNREETQYKKFRARVRAMEENGGMNILALILNSSSFNEFLTAVDDMRCIMESDKALEKKYIEARQETEEIKTEYEAERAEYEEKQDELRKEQQELETKIEEAFATLDELAEEIEKAKKEQEAAEIQMEAAGAAIQNMIDQLMEQKRQEAMQNVVPNNPAPSNPAPDASAPPAADNGGGDTSGGDTSGGGSTDDSYNDGGGSGWEDSNSGGGYVPDTGGTGSFIWPVPCSNRVTSRYGPRIHPITGEVGRMHNGIDIDGFGNEGGEIVAADSGTVTVASYDRGYGNYVIVDHGNNQTLYAHMSGFAVQQGDYVSQGQTVGYLGSTGMSTGTHCHFEMFINGQRVDPASYYSGIVFWNC